MKGQVLQPSPSPLSPYIVHLNSGDLLLSKVLPCGLAKQRKQSVVFDQQATAHQSAHNSSECIF
jgi:hypothetical protein